MSKHIALPRLNQLAASIAVVVGGLALVPAAHAAAPLAGTNISNIASASYNDAAGRTQTVTSNEVKTTVIQVASFTLAADRTTTSNPNGQVSLVHTLTNTGNGTDTFTINTANIGGDNFDFATIQVYLDANGDGVADNTTNLAGQTVTLTAGQSVNLIVVTTTPAVATSGQNGKLTISATSKVAVDAADSVTQKTNTDTVNVTANAVIQVTKSASVSAVKSGDTIEYTLTYKNTGNTTATDVTLTDVIPANLTYTAGTAVWSGSGTNLTDAADTDGYDFNITQAGRLTFKIPSVAANTTGTLKFKVTVNAAAPAGAITNTAYYSYDPDGPTNGNTGTTPVTTPEPSNPSTVTVAATYLGAINDSATLNYNDGERNTTTQTDSQTKAIAQGETATFNTYVWNRGNSTESYNLTSVLTGLVAGTTVQFFKADGVTPLTDTSGDTTVDTGPIAPNTNQLVVVKITPPSTSITSGSVTVTADPVDNASAAANDVTTLNVNITAATVDLTKNGSTNVADGDGKYIAGTATDLIVQTATVEAGQPATLQLAVTNDGTNPDNYNLSVANLPSGWTAVFYQDTNGDGQPDGAPITNTGNVPAGQTVKLVAVVTPPANALPGNNDLVFTILSPATGLTDSLKDRVIVDENRSLIFTPDRNGQIAPGGTVVYTHTLTNTGNVTEGLAGTDLNIAIGNTLTGTNTSVYVDVDNNGIADAGELVTGTNLTALLAGTAGGAGLQPGEAVRIFVKVEAPAGATDGQQDVATITITPTGVIGDDTAPAALKVTDVTTINNGQIRLLKEQALDANCDGTEDSGLASYTQGTISAKPGTCVIYRITATNDGSVPVTTLVINDATPAFTTLAAAPTPSNDGTTGTVTAPAAGATGNVSNPVGNLAPTATAKLKFGVKINPVTP
ncbi:beta strand repeat-containing protein [Alkanindiges illinoisensis]|uniref:DUF11 domain-containing protein n=1 Tax=Alkanindiges illinoisensis TaxID=197183 RepID=A0A4Y7XB91_9GAMM|nr:NEW3 domain-containing protein [Alkanindiges illinoisensis]TEU25583.1 DUF11 domain-containing protein [Alkanindiges illinoisensis]